MTAVTGDPRQAGSAAEFVALLRQLKERSGFTYRQLEERAARRGEVLARSTVADTLRRQALPRTETLVAFLHACAPAEEVAIWLEARSRLARQAAPARGDSAASSPCVPNASQHTGRGPGADRPVVPRQLPAPPAFFAGRVDELAHLDEAAEDRGETVVISAIGGAGGIGKTSLALQWAHMRLDRFPDGQLYADLRGYGPELAPVAPQVTLRNFLEALGVPPASVPKDLDVQAALYRSVVAGRRMLVVLDNARDTTQVVPLLPGSPTCTVLVTSRHRLRGLTVTHGARLLTLDLLSAREARDMLAGHLGRRRVADQQQSLDTLVEHCGGLPLALGIVAARAAANPAHPLDALAQELRDASARLSALSAGEARTDLRAVFSWSYHALEPQAATVFDLLGAVPTVDLGLAAVAGLTATPLATCRELLQQLEDTSLVHQYVPGRYRMHDLVHLYSADGAQPRSRRKSRDAALRRLVDHYLHTAYAADRLLDSRRPPVALAPPSAGCAPQPLRDTAEAMAWFDLEHPRLIEMQQVAMRRGWYPQVWQLARTLVTFHARRRRSRDQLAVWQLGLEAAEIGKDLAMQAMAHRYLGQAYTAERQGDDAFEQLDLALVCARSGGVTGEEARTHYALAVGWERYGDLERALVHARQALTLFRSISDLVEEARALNAIGWICAGLRRYEEAEASCRRALALFRRHEHPDGEADTLHSLGLIAQSNGKHAESLTYYGQALTTYRGVGNTRGEAESLASLGDVYAALSRYADALQVWQQALDLLQRQQRVKEALLLRERMSNFATLV
ncbi:tetratricopeptide repeat protein [Microbispora sp. H10670]|uniref:tetratricopeptide repeat protein n=1 Tax=Microbispora sp. H10670 TaxID=2729108 RepID=UPI001603D633|nr:tetratricopeptide repeat protein [Microbispora sp. H10670]